MADRQLFLLNREAGAHRIPDDARELDAAIRAGEESLRRAPYYLARFGERGQRFTRSDSAWLATLADTDQGHVDQQVEWLGSVLSARGMPRLLLEQHLEVLADTLAAAVPERAVAYEKLRRAGARLRARRVAALADEDLAALAGRFDALTGEEWARPLPGIGALLVAAVIDEARGTERAVSSLVDWVGDRNLFSARWVAAVEETVRAARAQVHRR